MKGKIREGRMLIMSMSPQRKRKTTPSPPVTKARGSPSMSRKTRDPNMRSVSKPIPISRPIAYTLFSVKKIMSLKSLVNPCSASKSAPKGILSLIGQ